MWGFLGLTGRGIANPPALPGGVPRVGSAARCPNLSSIPSLGRVADLSSAAVGCLFRFGRGGLEPDGGVGQLFARCPFTPHKLQFLSSLLGILSVLGSSSACLLFRRASGRSKDW